MDFEKSLTAQQFLQYLDKVQPLHDRLDTESLRARVRRIVEYAEKDLLEQIVALQHSETVLKANNIPDAEKDAIRGIPFIEAVKRVRNYLDTTLHEAKEIANVLRSVE